MLSLWLAQHLNSQQVGNKTKRTVSSEGVNYGEPNTVWLYTDNLKPPATPRISGNLFSSSKPLALIELQPAKIIEPPKEIHQPNLYEVQQSPSTLVSNVKQLLSPETDFNQEIQQYKAPIFQNQSPNIQTSETIVSPVQHSHVIRNHNHHFPGQKVHPLFNVQSTYQIPKKYAYVNGKIIYDPTNFHLQQAPLQQAPLQQSPLQQAPFQTTPNFFHSAQTFHPQHLQKQQLINFHNRLIPRPNLSPPAVPQNSVNPPAITKFNPPKMHAIDVPSHAPVNAQKSNQNVKKRKEDPKPVSEEEEPEEETEENSPYNEEEDDHYEDERPFHEKYSLDYEDGDHYDLKEDEYNSKEEPDEDTDSKRGSSRVRYVTTKARKHPKKKYRPGKKSEVYYSSKYESPDRYYPKKTDKKHKVQYKEYKYSKNSDDPDVGYSESIPVLHKQKLFKEKWYVSKSMSDKKKYNEE